jgi:hypothetical protein
MDGDGSHRLDDHQHSPHVPRRGGARGDLQRDHDRRVLARGRHRAAIGGPGVAVTAASGVGYLLLNGLLLFDYGNTIVGLAAPLLALCLVWAGCSFTRILIETSERANLTQRFSQYVDPTLRQLRHRAAAPGPPRGRDEGADGRLHRPRRLYRVDGTIGRAIGHAPERVHGPDGPDHPPPRRLREQVPRRRDHVLLRRAVHNPNHAADAVAAALDMQEAMGPLGEELQRQDLPVVSMRIGISTRRMVVGEAGPDDASDTRSWGYGKAWRPPRGRPTR